MYVYRGYILLVDYSLKYYSDLLCLSLRSLFSSLFCLIEILVPQLFVFGFFHVFCLEYFFWPFTFSLCRSLVLRWVSLDNIHANCVFLPTQLPYAFWLEHLIHLHLRLLLPLTCSLPFFPLYLCSPFFLYFKVVPLASLTVLAWWRCTLF